MPQNAECNFCKKKGHIVKVFQSRLKQKSGTHQMPAEDDTEPLEYSLFHTQSSNRSPAVEYLGHKISGQGLQPTDEKIQAIKSAPAPQDVTQLKSFLGLINYYSNFLPNLSNTLAPLYRLLQKNTRWCWESEQRKTLQPAKESLTSHCVLVHFYPAMQLILACDASPYGIGAVLSHRMDIGKDKPI